MTVNGISRKCEVGFDAPSGLVRLQAALGCKTFPRWSSVQPSFVRSMGRGDMSEAAAVDRMPLRGMSLGALRRAHLFTVRLTVGHGDLAPVIRVRVLDGDPFTVEQQ